MDCLTEPVGDLWEGGINPRIRDRFDLAVECIRRHYQGHDSPLSDGLARYADFFRLFGDFAGYIDFFYLQDLVTPDHAEVQFMAPFDGFQRSPIPATRAEALAYRAKGAEFMRARNHRIAAAVKRSTKPVAWREAR